MLWLLCQSSKHTPLGKFWKEVYILDLGLSLVKRLELIQVLVTAIVLINRLNHGDGRDRYRVAGVSVASEWARATGPTMRISFQS